VRGTARTINSRGVLAMKELLFALEQELRMAQSCLSSCELYLSRIRELMDPKSNIVHVTGSDESADD